MRYRLQERSLSIANMEYQQPRTYLASPNPAETAELNRASLNMLFLSASSTLFLLSRISLRNVWTCLLIALHTSFDSRSSDATAREAPGLAGLARCVWTIDSRAVTKASWRYAKVNPSVILAIAEDICVGNLRAELFDNNFNLSAFEWSN